MDAVGESSKDGLVVREVRKSYATPTEPLAILRGVSFDLAAGASLAIMGPSGSGKTTLLNILGTLDAPTAGTVTLNGTDPFGLAPRDLARFRSRSVGFVFQEHHLLPQCTAIENVLVACLAAGRVTAEQERRAADLLERVGLADRADHLPAELSGGERQRVAVARALVNEPALVLGDEPTGNLDAAAAAGVGDLLQSLAAEHGAMVVVVTHNRDLADRFDRRLLFSAGRLEETPDA